MIPGDATAQLTVLVGNGANVVVLTPLGSTPLAEHEASRDTLVASVASRFEAGRPVRPTDNLFVERGANDRVTRVVRRFPQARADFALSTV